MKKRDWGTWASRFREEVNSTSGLFGMATAGVAGVGLAASAPMVTAAGAALTACIAIYSGVRAIPAARPAAKQALGKRFLDLNELRQLHPPISRIGFVGVSQSGKTTLLSNINAAPAPTSERTDSPYADVTCLSGYPDTMLALIDAAGQQYGQQFKVVDESDSLVIVLDHNSSAFDKDADRSRIQQQEDFLFQLAGYVSTSRKSLKNVCMLMNKSDLWANGSSHREVKDWLDGCHRAWNMVPGIRLTARFHSNFHVQDASGVIGMLKGWL